MKRTPLFLGSFLLILGIIVYELGLSMTLHQQVSLLAFVTNLFPDVQTVELVGILLQLSGGVIIVSGFVSTVSSIVSIELENQRRNLVDEILAKLEEKIGKMLTRQSSNVTSQVSQITRTCRFCGAKLDGGDRFCPSCGKSQT